MNENDNQSINTNEPEKEIKMKELEKRAAEELTKRGEAFWASLAIMITEGTIVNFFSLPTAGIVALVMFTTSEGGELTLMDYAGYAVTKAALIVPLLVIITNLFVMLCEKSNEHESAMKIFNAVIYVLYPVICLGVVAAYWIFR